MVAAIQLNQFRKITSVAVQPDNRQQGLMGKIWNSGNKTSKPVFVFTVGGLTRQQR